MAIGATRRLPAELTGGTIRAGTTQAFRGGNFRKTGRWTADG